MQTYSKAKPRIGTSKGLIGKAMKKSPPKKNVSPNKKRAGY